MSVCDWLRRHVARAAHLTLDSRRVEAGDVFLACPGEAGDGRRYIESAAAAGVGAVIYDPDDRPAELDVLLANLPVPALAVPGLRRRAGEVAAEWYGHPSRQLTVIAVTGTNGKTTCTQWVAQALENLGRPCGIIGTLGVRYTDGSQEETGLTTPDAVTLHRVLARMVREGAAAVALEASSIGLAQGRLAGLQVSIAAFTNLTRDHLDAHGDMATYEAAKAALFAWPDLTAAVINMEDAAGGRLLAATGATRVLGYTRSAVQDAVGAAATDAVAEVDGAGIVPVLRARDLQLTGQETLFTLCLPQGASALVRSAIPGLYNIDNMLLVAGVLYALDTSPPKIAAAVNALRPVPGRLQTVSVAGVAGPTVVVDYAHTPDALQGALAALRPLAQARGGRLLCVFGCGGGRDPGKRAPMGAVAVAGADAVTITSDNPRGEAPQAIIEQIVTGLPADAAVSVEPDRANAILRAVWSAQPADVVLLAGKGHETTQEINGVQHVFSDIEWARAALQLPSVVGVTTDTRTVRPGELFIALKGDTFDGHAFLDVAAAAGACAAIVERPMQAALPTIALGDTRAALLKLGAAWRRRYDIPVVGVTGSNGKTTTKEMIAAILSVHHGAGRVLATHGNLNNDIGVPLTLLRLREHHRCAVVELGMNHPGEIRVLAEAAAPTIALVTNAQREHQEFMHTVEAVARENGAVFAALPANGMAVYPGDETYTDIWDALSEGRVRLRFGLDDALDARADEIQAEAHETRFQLRTPQGAVAVTLPVVGPHNLRNALAAAACAQAAGTPLAEIARGLGGFAAVRGRMQSHRLADGTLLIDDTYNANPDSVRAAIVVLAAMPGERRVLVLGDMGEVGEQGPAMHAEVGEYARQMGVESLLCLGDAARAAAEAFGAGARHFARLDQLVPVLEALRPAAILVKGSRFMRMERVVEALGATPGATGEAGHAA